MKRLRPSLFQIALLVSAAWTATLGVWLLVHRPTSFAAFDDRSILRQEFRQFSYRPSSFLSPPVSPVPHALALEADRHLLDGDFRAAYQSYRAAVDSQPSDLYSRFLAACLALELGQTAEAHELSADALERGSGVRCTHLLRRLVDEVEQHPDSPWSTSYLSSLVRLSRDPGIALLPDSDPLYDLIERRVLGPVFARSIPADALLRSSLQLQDSPGDFSSAREVLESTMFLPLQLQALTVLNSSGNPGDLRLMAEVLERLRLDEPDNAYYDLLLATLEAPAFLHLEFEETATPGDLNPEAMDALTRTYQKDLVEAHAGDVFRFTVEARRASGQVFPELHVPPASQTVFLGDPYLSRRLLQRALEWTGVEDTLEWKLVAATGLRVLRAYPDTETGLLPRVPAPHLDLARQFLVELADRGPTAALRREIATFRPLLLPPPTLEQLRRYVLLPLPIPRLVQGFLLRYGARPVELAADAWRAVEES